MLFPRFRLPACSYLGIGNKADTMAIATDVMAITNNVLNKTRLSDGSCGRNFVFIIQYNVNTFFI